MNNDVPRVVRCGKPQVEGLVRLFQQQGIPVGIRAHAVMPELELAPRVINPRVDEGLGICRPRKAIARVTHNLVNDVAAGCVLNDPRPAFVPFGITRPSDQASICGWNQFPDFEELFTLSTQVFIEKELLTFQGFGICQHRSFGVVQGRNSIMLRVGILVELALEVPPVTNSLRS